MDARTDISLSTVSSTPSSLPDNYQDRDTLAIQEEKAKGAGSGATVEEDEEMGGCIGNCCAPETDPLKVFLRLSACLCAGLVFGWSLEKGRGEYRPFKKCRKMLCLGYNVSSVANSGHMSSSSKNLHHNQPLTFSFTKMASIDLS